METMHAVDSMSKKDTFPTNRYIVWFLCAETKLENLFVGIPTLRTNCERGVSSCRLSNNVGQLR